ncbi:ferritin-like domain-containing protein [Stenotrophomonas sp. HITSZ_GD]|uniref:ferritin-like domain-containing protein n=1 Tax=Stenotrophomonas sp. HITSZ_GD TaxID=3037248 RepID=UPI00240D15CC|nr:ferritin-like domain-containing protein [Stenotrophomonas sp. HITSZ_GD]MDG2526564.1 ferritin-like domain-containing protein [Stenotrophomonas sp. HITSZ_GD]
MRQEIAVPTSREQLWGLLAEAAEIEHHLMCCYLYAAFSLKEHADEDLGPDELAAVRRWRQQILGVAIEEMGHLATVCNILSALGAPAHLAHQNFPVSPGYHPAGVVVKLTPFNAQTLDHFIYLERPEDSPLADGEGFEPARDYQRDSRMDRLMSVATDYDTVGELYRSISLGLEQLVAALGPERVFIGDPAHQLSAEVARLPGLRVVQCLKTAQIAITAIVEQGESAAAAQETSHYQRFLAIRREYQALRDARPGFRPARMSAHNPVMRRPPTPEGKLWVTLEPAASLMDIGNALYNHSLRCLSLAYGGVDARTQRVLVQTSIDLMHLLTPVATCLGTLAASPELPEATAGISFATLRDAAALLPDTASLDLLIERLEEIRMRCGELLPRHAQVEALLQATCAGLKRTVERLARARETVQPLHAMADDAAVLAPSSTTVPQASPAAAAAPPAEPATDPSVPHAIPEPIDEGHGVQRIPGPAIDLIYNGQRCIHARHCVLGLPGVFKANVEGPWIDPAAASVEELVTVAHLCPSGAIGYRRHDGGAEEAPPAVNLVQLRENGPLGLRAQIVLNGEPIGMRAVLCRCGASRHKPFCDGSHNDIHFQATGEPATVASEPLAARGGVLEIEAEINGPLSVTGNLEICCGTGRTINRVTGTRLCRCGGSSNKPYCDGTHRTNGFQG